MRGLLSRRPILAVPVAALIVATASTVGGQTIRVENARYERELEPYPGNPVGIEVLVRGSVIHPRPVPLFDYNRLLSVACNLNTEHVGDVHNLEDPEYFDWGGGAFLTEQDQVVSCPDGALARFKRCMIGTQDDVDYLGWVGGTLYRHLNPDIDVHVLPLRSTHCEPFYALGGSVSGLSAGDYLAIEATVALADGTPYEVNRVDQLHNGAFAFSPLVPDGASYEVEVADVSDTGIECEVHDGSGRIAGRDVDDVRIECRCINGAAGPCFESYPIGGTVEGLGDNPVLLENEGSQPPPVTEVFTDQRTMHRNGIFHFSTRIRAGGTYSVHVAGQPSDERTCTVINGSGTVIGHVQNVIVQCTCDDGSSDCGSARFPPGPGFGDHFGQPGRRAGTCRPLREFCFGDFSPWFFFTDEYPPGCTTVCEQGPRSCEGNVCEDTLDCRVVCGSTVSSELLAGPDTGVYTPDEGAVAAGVLEVTGFAVDPEGVAAMVFFIGDEEAHPLSASYGLFHSQACAPPRDRPWCDPNSGFSVRLDISRLPTGTHELTVVAIDGAGTDGEHSVPTIINRDFVVGASCSGSPPPAVSLDSPAPGAVVGGVVQLAANASDDGAVAAVEFYADGGRVGRDTSADPGGVYAVDWDTTAIQGRHVLEARAIDDCGRERSSAPVAVDVDNGLRVSVAATGAHLADGSTFSFPETSIDGLPVSRLFDLCNDGLVTVDLFNPGSLVATGPPFHQVGSPPPTTLAPGACSRFRVRFNTVNPDAYGGRIAIEHSFAGSPYEIDLEGSALPSGSLPEIRLELTATGSPIADGGTFAFPPTQLAQMPVSRQFSVCNDGGSELRIDNPASLVTGDGFSQLSTPTPLLAPGECTVFRVRFNTTVPGAHEGAIAIDNDDPDEDPYQVALSGVALDGAAPELRVEHAASGAPVAAGGFFAFPPAPQTELPISHLFRICNDGGENLVIGNPGGLVTGTGFTSIVEPVPVVAPGSCTLLRVRFVVGSVGSFAGQVSIQSNDPVEDPYAFGLGATALASPPPEIRVVHAGSGATLPDGGSFTFPATRLADLPISRLFEICNDGTGMLEVHNPTSLVSGTGFHLLSSPSSAIAPGACSAFRVRFNTVTAGAHSGTLRVRNNDPSEDPYDVYLSALAQPDLPSEIRLEVGTPGLPVADGGAFTFPATAVGQPISRLFRVCNDGGGDLVLSAPVVSGDGFSRLGVPDPVVPPGECTDFRVRFHKAVPGDFTGAVTLPNNDPQEASYDVVLEAAAVP